MGFSQKYFSYTIHRTRECRLGKIAKFFQEIFLTQSNGNENDILAENHNIFTDFFVFAIHTDTDRSFVIKCSFIGRPREWSKCGRFFKKNYFFIFQSLLPIGRPRENQKVVFFFDNFLSLAIRRKKAILYTLN